MADRDPFKPDFQLTVGSEGGRLGTVIEVSGELDSGSSEELLSTVRDAVSSGTPELMLELTQMTFVDSAGMRTLILIERLAAEHRIPLTVRPPPEHVTELLRTAGLVDRSELAADTAPGSSASVKFVERTELELPRDPHSPARARVEVRERVAGHDRPELTNLVLLTSELVTNAVVHPRGVGDTSIGLCVTVYKDRVRVEVEDSGEGFAYAVPVLPEGERGRGLFLVDRFSDRWGCGRVESDQGTRFRVWFELGWTEQGAQAVA